MLPPFPALPLAQVLKEPPVQSNQRSKSTLSCNNRWSHHNNPILSGNAIANHKVVQNNPLMIQISLAALQELVLVVHLGCLELAKVTLVWAQRCQLAQHQRRRY